jgi:hypothetical protein
MRDTSRGQADGRNTVVFSLPMAKESGPIQEKCQEFPKKSGWRGFFMRARDPFTNITVPRFLREILETIREVTCGLPYPTPDHPISCECPACLHALESLP